MKKILFLVMFSLLIFISIKEVNASSNSFYDAEVVPGVYVASEYQNIFINDLLKVIRDSNTGNVAYCLEPFVDFSAGNFVNDINFGNISEEKWTRLNLIAYYGYGYEGHSESKWFSITQLLIWREVMPQGSFYFTDGVNGPVVDSFNKEVAEIYSLVDNHLLKPSFDKMTYDIPLGNNFTVTDTNGKLISYHLTSTNSGNNLRITNNTIEIIANEVGKYTVEVSLFSFNNENPSFYYYSDSGQDIITRGKPVDIISSFEYNIIDTNLIINKLDFDTKTNVNIYDSLLEGAVYHIYNDDMSYSREIAIDSNKQIIINNIPFGKYYIKETKAGYGYNIDFNIYEIEITKDMPTLEIDLYNKRIIKNISITKTTSDGVLSNFEKGIEFAIYDDNSDWFASILTDDLGFASINLPYGTFLFKQLNTTDGYYMVEDFLVRIDENTTVFNYDLVDFKIPVPNTSSTTYHIERLVYIIEKKYLFMFS